MAFSNIFIKAGFWKRTSHPTKGDLSLDDILVTLNDSITTLNNSINALTISKNVQQEVYQLGLIGSTIKAEPIGMVLANSTSSGTLTDGRLDMTVVYLASDQTITGVKWAQNTQGNYTADNYNGVGLYSYSAGTFTLVASSTNDGAIWKGASLSFQSKAFSSTYSAIAGIYGIGVLYNSSAQVAAPAIAANASIITNLLDLSNSLKLTSTLDSQTTLPTSQVTSALTLGTIRKYVALY